MSYENGKCTVSEAIILLKDHDHQLIVESTNSHLIDYPYKLLNRNGFKIYQSYGGSSHCALEKFYSTELSDQLALLQTAKDVRFFRIWVFVVMPPICYKHYKYNNFGKYKIDDNSLSVELLLGSLKGADQPKLQEELKKLHSKIKTVQLDYYPDEEEEAS